MGVDYYLARYRQTSLLYVSTSFSPSKAPLKNTFNTASMTSDQTIAYISDVAADFLKPLFIVACSITAVSFILDLIFERYLRHSGRLMPNMRTRERVLSSLAILGSVIGGAGLILLSVFDTRRHPKAHDAFLLVFIVGVALSAIFTIVEVCLVCWCWYC